MLEYLHIRDLALISDMELEFASGMNVLTGETGAGKSFILKALNFLMGERLGADMVRPGKERAQVEALFMRSGEELIVRRELIAETGRSRLFINDTLASQETIKELRTTLLVHTSQHGQQKLLQPNFQAKLIDDWMNQPDLLAARNTLLKELKEAAERRKRSGLVSESLRIAGNSLKCTSRRSKKFLLLKAKKNSLKPCVRSGAGPSSCGGITNGRR